ncbi:MAG: SPOR domain-containing protein [Georgfuchsia sp.]
MSDASVADPSIDLKKRARRRLVGAVALALLAVIVLPVVMDSEPKPSGQDIQIRIPSRNSSDSLTAREIPGRPMPPQLPKDQQAPKPELAAETPISMTPDIAEKPTLPQVTNTVTEMKAGSAQKAEAVRAEAVLEGKDVEQWVVKLGAYQNISNVKQLANKLKDMSLPSYTEKIDLPQGPRTRVLAGPFKSRELANKARLRIIKIGVDGQVAQK